MTALSFLQYKNDVSLVQISKVNFRGAFQAGETGAWELCSAKKLKQYAKRNKILKKHRGDCADARKWVPLSTENSKTGSRLIDINVIWRILLAVHNSTHVGKCVDRRQSPAAWSIARALDSDIRSHIVNRRPRIASKYSLIERILRIHATKKHSQTTYCSLT